MQLHVETRSQPGQALVILSGAFDGDIAQHLAQIMQSTARVWSYTLDSLVKAEQWKQESKLRGREAEIAAHQNHLDEYEAGLKDRDRELADAMAELDLALNKLQAVQDGMPTSTAWGDIAGLLKEDFEAARSAWSQKKDGHSPWPPEPIAPAPTAPEPVDPPDAPADGPQPAEDDDIKF